MRHVDLCSGIGGFALGFEWAQLSIPILFCDTDDWCRRILGKHWSHVPIAENVKDLANDPEGLVPDCDILTAGYPCQPFSVAGKQRGAKDDRHIWPEIRTIVEAKRPTWCVFENVYGHISMGLDEVLSDLEAIGYATRPFVVPACGVNAPHRRNRVWIIARDVADTESAGLQGHGQEHELSESERKIPTSWTRWWEFEPDVGRVAHGIPRRVDRIRGLGNAIVPQIAQQIGEAIKKVEQRCIDA